MYPQGDGAVAHAAPAYPLPFDLTAVSAILKATRLRQQFDLYCAAKLNDYIDTMSVLGIRSCLEIDPPELAKWWVGKTMNGLDHATEDALLFSQMG